MKRSILILIVFSLLPILSYAQMDGKDALNERPQIKVLTFNIWGIIGAKHRMDRMDAIGKRIAEVDPDILAIEEAFEWRHRRKLLNSLQEAGYKYESKLYFRNVYGSGILFISKYPVVESDFQQYRVLGGWKDIEWLGGKGIAYLRLDTPWGGLDFFHTHAIARMTPIFDELGQYIPGDDKEVDRLLNMYQIDRYVEGMRTGTSRSIIAAGDFNVSPEMLEYNFLMALTGFESSFDTLHPGENPSTFSVENVFVDDDYSRIDHIFYKNYDAGEGFWVKPVESRVTMDGTFELPGKGTSVNYSDHYGLLTVFEVVTEEGAVEYSPEGVTGGKCLCKGCALPGVSGGTINLTEDNLGYWQGMALKEYAESWRKEKRKNQVLIPLAEVVVAGSEDLPKQIELPAGAMEELK